MAILIIATSQLGPGAPSAHAANKDGKCDVNELCLWRDADFTGCVYDADASTGRGKGDNPNDLGKVRYVTCPSTPVGNSVTSYRNNTDLLVVMYERPNQKGASYCLAPGASGNVVPQFNDKANSLNAGQPTGDEKKYCTYYDAD